MSTSLNLNVWIEDDHPKHRFPVQIACNEKIEDLICLIDQIGQRALQDTPLEDLMLWQVDIDLEQSEYKLRRELRLQEWRTRYCLIADRELSEVFSENPPETRLNIVVGRQHSEY